MILKSEGIHMKYPYVFNVFLVIMAFFTGFIVGKGRMMQPVTETRDSKSSLSETSATGVESKTQGPVKLLQTMRPRLQEPQKGMDLSDTLEHVPEGPPKSPPEIAMQQFPTEIAHELDPNFKKDMLSSLRENGVPERDIQNIMRGLEPPMSAEVLDSLSESGDLPPDELVRDVESSLRQAGVPSQDIGVVVDQFEQATEAQALGTNDPSVGSLSPQSEENEPQE
jgi:hypothetical protein